MRLGFAIGSSSHSGIVGERSRADDSVQKTLSRIDCQKNLCEPHSVRRFAIERSGAAAILWALLPTWCGSRRTGATLSKTLADSSGVHRAPPIPEVLVSSTEVTSFRRRGSAYPYWRYDW